MKARASKQAFYWDGMAVGYDHKYGYDSTEGQEKLLRKANALVEIGRISPKSEILEIGFGTGAFTRLLARTAGKVVAVDVSRRMWLVAQRAWEETTARDRFNIWYIQADIHECVWANLFDCIVGAYSLMYTNIPTVLQVSIAALRPGGRIALIEINGLNPIAFVKTAPTLKQLLGVSAEAQSHTPHWWRRALTQAGFQHIEIEVIEQLRYFPRILGGSLLISGTKPDKEA